MADNFAIPTPVIRSKIGTRVIGGKLCLLNQNRAEGWICAGSSRRVWEKLQKNATIPEIAADFQAKYGISNEKATADIVRFVEHLWQRQIVDIPGREHITAEQRSAMVKQEPDNQSGKMFALATSANTLCKMWIDLLIPCNLRCRHCYLDFSHKDIMPYDKVIDIVDQLAAHGAAEIILTGGEIFMRKDLLDIIAHVESHGFLFDLYTNANYIDEPMADKLAKFAIQTVQISVYGTTAETHEAITKKAGTFDKSITAARLLTERGVRVRLACHVQHDNFEEVYKFPDFAKSIGAEYEFDTKLVPNRDGSMLPLGYGVTMAQQAELYKAKLIKQPKTDTLCTAAVTKGRISAAGDIYPCELINTATVGNLYRNTLAEIWASRWRTELRSQILGYKPHRCGGCGHSSDCVPCAAMRGFNLENHMEAPVSEACLLTTADLISRGKTIADNSPAGAAAKGCVEHLMAKNVGRMIKDALIQITAATG
jgi:radical SAM protein with 4Fe4S-binding SPASM domain